MPEETDYPESIHKSMIYSILAGGKRLRPILVIAATEAVGGNRVDILPFAVAVEYIHTYTLRPYKSSSESRAKQKHGQSQI